MVDAIDTNAAAAARGVTVSRTARSNTVAPPVAKPPTEINRPDAPAKEVARIDSPKVLDAAIDSSSEASVAQAGGAGLYARSTHITPLTSDSGLTTYHDQDSGRVVVRIFDRESGEVLVEFPLENQRQVPGAPDPPGPARPKTSLDV